MNLFLLVTIKLLIGFFAMVIIINISGKGNLSPSSASDQIINYVFGGVMGSAIYNSSVRIPDFIVVLCIWCVFVLSMKWVKKRNLKAKQLIDGKALIIIDDGKIDITVEQNGQFIIIQAGEENPKFPIITDGQVQTDILKVIGKDEEWLLDELKKQGIYAYSDVFLGEYVDKTVIITPYE